ncbi:hypothetical protein BASA81_000929 [Batrachochytrium salamandrivorans]|nr:hypothetical protein BASA81_000929 [Batrachochytrium salamandrivorans]
MFWPGLLLLLAVVTTSVRGGEPYPHLSYAQINSQMAALVARFPEFAKLTTAQSEFGLPSPGECGSEGPCVTQIVHLTDFATLHANRPEVYISGALHGDERVGPHSVLEFARVLLEGRHENAWLEHLLRTRSIYLTPMTNSLGYFANQREENGIDPNRDYPIDQVPGLCMQTVTSRVVNELFRVHLFQLAITFHAGMEAIAVEWGTMSRRRRDQHASPDDAAMLQLGSFLGSFAGSARQGAGLYPVGRMNDLVYPVPGGMEDWAYAGNWDPESSRLPCTPHTFGGYAQDKTQYSNSMLRVVNVLVETSDAKWPDDLGEGGEERLNAKSFTGHIPRNVRLALMLVDVVEPYVVVTRAAWMGNQLVVEWEVGGAFKVDETQVLVEWQGTNRTSNVIRNQVTRWASGAYADRSEFPFKSDFTACIDMEREEGEAVIWVRARVDSSWAKRKSSSVFTPAGFPPQSHWVNARTNVNWTMENAGKRIQGKLDWYSQPVVVVAAGRGERKDAECERIYAFPIQPTAPAVAEEKGVNIHPLYLGGVALFVMLGMGLSIHRHHHKRQQQAVGFTRVSTKPPEV